MSNEDIKMSDVFDLPFSVEASGMIVDKEAFVTADICGSMSHSKAAAHAINNHDPMALRIKELEAVVAKIQDIEYQNCKNDDPASEVWRLCRSIMEKSK